MRISANRPRKVDASRLVTSACSGASGSPFGGGTLLFEHLEQRIQVGAVGNLAVGRRRGARHPGAPGCVQRRQAQRVFGRCGRFVVKVGRDI